MRYGRTLMMLAAVVLMSCQESLEERCAREARSYTDKHCPMRVGKGNEVVMDSMTFDIPTRTISYIYTLSGRLDDAANIQGERTRDQLLQQLRNSTDLKLYKEAGYNFRYVYYSQQKKGTKLFEASFHENDYR